MSLKEKPKPCSLTPSATRPAMSFKRRPRQPDRRAYRLQRRFCAPCAIDYQTVISCAPRDDRTVRVIAADYDNQPDEFSRRADYQPRHPAVVELCPRRGKASAAAEQPLWRRGSGNQRQCTAGCGLSSSASLEVAVGTVFQQLYHLPLDGAQIALNGRGGKPVRRLQLRHHGSADFSAGQKTTRC